jgi:hypothetical protein
MRARADLWEPWGSNPPGPPSDLLQPAPSPSGVNAIRRSDIPRKSRPGGLLKCCERKVA